MRLVALPDDLLCRILSGTDFQSRCIAHRVCRKWNELLLNPASSEMWHDTPSIALDNVQSQCTARQEKFSRLAHWLSARAATLGVVHISCAKFRSNPQEEEEAKEDFFTDAHYFAERHLPYLLGRLHVQQLRLKLDCLLGEAELFLALTASHAAVLPTQS